MTITPDDLTRIARLAELEVASADRERLAAQLDGIVGYVGQLADLATDLPTPGSAPTGAVLREDRVDRIPLAFGVETLAPEYQDGFFLVPRLPAMDG